MANEYSNRDELEIEPKEVVNEEGEADITPLQYELLVYPADYTIDGLYQLWNEEDMVLPSFQRKYVWDIKRASELIESIMMGLPIPPIFFYIDDTHRYHVVDGWQRLQSIFFFKEGYFGDIDRTGRQKIFSIKGISDTNPLFGKTYINFSDAQRRTFNGYVLRSTMIKQLNPKDNKSIYHIFKRLNTGGMALQDQEVRNCVFEGKLNNLFKRLNAYDNWRKILGKDKPDRRQRDVGYLLRCIALLHQHDCYQKPMREFLNQFMLKNKNPSSDFLKREEERFKKTCDIIVEKLGQKPFHPKHALSPSMLDSIFTAFAQNLDRCPENIRDKFANLWKNEEFKKAVSDATTDNDVVAKRINLAKSILFG